MRQLFHGKRISVCTFFVLLTLALAGMATAATPSTDAGSGAAGQGKIIETMNSGGYTYLLVESGKDKTWVAIPETTVKTGQTVSYQAGMTMKDFHSKTLDRTFAALVFSPGLDGNPAGDKTGPATSAPAGDKGSFASAVEAEKTAEAPPASTSGGSGGAVVPFAEIAVDKASGPNGYTVHEIFLKAKDLNGKTVRVQGKVMKINMNIMGRNWVHLQDGSGDPLTNTHDLVVTTAATPTEGTVVTAEGTMVADKDFGAGYAYAAIVEDAKFLP
ncbi:DNA-binding protein [Desulfoprunum benzoelyticum]|uniref:DNA-binding protein n=1 Tax=Desulfoprunum benzoelyticum TaxID=1506996 RepID=A0A840UMV8_9BACT|nr:DNA-binding protein [Desulfoprunum benzoelyticum]MBB5347112.1 hypothetical protein [Desulfoprunum benzoelyticum]MBM9529805.1 DNA-binding protein [Desulfoprunum benzoelyticum]